MEHAADQDHPKGEVGAAKCDVQRHARTGAPADEVRRPTHHCLEEGDRVLCHQLISNRPLHIRGPPVAAPLRREQAKARGQCLEGRHPGPRVGPSRMQQHERVAVAVLVIPGTNPAKLHVTRHCGHSPLKFLKAVSSTAPPLPTHHGDVNLERPAALRTCPTRERSAPPRPKRSTVTARACSSSQRAFRESRQTRPLSAGTRSRARHRSPVYRNWTSCPSGCTVGVAPGPKGVTWTPPAFLATSSRS
jgi:hypothetical protein